MTEAKVPDNKSDWTAIDIFLFSNGQQSSPPRKYHLVTEQLDWWKSTLNYLAQAQYGSMYSMIDLYTIEGNKLENPLELSHNTAYVAVVPPDYFIDAGYGKYLIKATRSWEKSQVRRTSNTAMASSAEEPQSLNNVPKSDEKDYESMNTKDNESGLKTIVASMVDNEASVIVKPQLSGAEKLINKQITSHSAKQPEKLIRPAVQHPTTAKKNNYVPSLPRTRKPSLKTRDSIKISTAPIKGRSSLSDANSNKVSIRSNIFKPMNTKQKTLPEAILSSVEEGIHEIKSPSASKMIGHRSSVIKIAETESNKQENESIVIPQLYKNTYSEKSSMQVNPEIMLSSNNDNNQKLDLCINRQGAVHELFKQNLYDKVENDGDSLTAFSHISKPNTCDPPLNEKKLLSPPAVSTTIKPDSNATAKINKEVMVNLKLNIEIWNKPNEVKITSNTVSKKDSLYMLNTEKGSQVDIEDKVVLNEMCGNETNHEVIIVNCLNHGNDDNTCNTFPVQNGNSNFLIFLPMLKLNETCKRCECNKELRETNAASIGNRINKMSCSSLQKEKAEKTVSRAEIRSRTNSTEIKVDNNEIVMVKRKSVAIREDELPKVLIPNEPLESFLEIHGKLFLNSQESDKPELLLLKKESTGVFHKITVNKFTQTEWCDVLWEARLQDDGHYSFHMPPLEMLKYNKL